MLLVAPPGGRRALAFQATLAQLGWPPARTVPYLDLMEGRARLPDLVRPGSVVRFDSPGEDLATEQALIRLGGGPDVRLADGEIAPTDAWHRGYSALMRSLAADLLAAPPHERMQDPEHVLRMFDKPATHAALSAAGVPVPDALPSVRSLDELVARADARGWGRVFVKLAHGSSASGTVALAWSARGVQAHTTVRQEGAHLYNSRRLQRVSGWPQVRALIDALAVYGVHVERWWPKASFAGHPMDLRAVVIGGHANHALVRLGKGPITNLHLGNERGDVSALRRDAGEERWAAVTDAATSALRAFPGALYGGVDVLLTPGYRTVKVLEVNAFGDYHRGVLHRGRDTYTAELAALPGAFA
ncbi:STM4014 family protein [Deinococcus aquiradiocola]|uniref:STM4014 family protein n=1 Tax=Deinococcus aquiradiocola TaxID=393059 RepID=UPI001667D6D1|nr:STM4014 family protein [Deinococcus aquiradiocola]